MIIETEYTQRFFKALKDLKLSKVPRIGFEDSYKKMSVETEKEALVKKYSKLEGHEIIKNLNQMINTEVYPAKFMILLAVKNTLNEGDAALVNMAGGVILSRSE